MKEYNLYLILLQMQFINRLCITIGQRSRLCFKIISSLYQQTCDKIVCFGEKYHICLLQDKILR